MFTQCSEVLPNDMDQNISIRSTCQRDSVYKSSAGMG